MNPAVLTHPPSTAADLGWPAMLAAACRGEGVHSVYQPIVDVARGVTVGYEALVRFHGWTPRSPEAWFTAARAHNHHVELEAAALRSALAAHASLPSNCFLTVNVSPDLLVEEPIRAVWREHGNLARLVVELTEQIPVASYAALTADLASLRAAGALLAVDDAGAGYAGLRHLLLLRPEIIKLDRDLVAGLDTDPAKTALVEMIGHFAGRLDAWLLAEGVERDAELEVLASLRVPLAQGYLFARPAPAWTDIDHDAAALARARTPHGRHGTVRAVLEAAPCTTEPSHVAAWLDQRPAVVVIDDHERPLSIHTATADGRVARHVGLRVHPDTPVRDALDRAMTRRDHPTVTPLVCTDSAGRYLGLVRPERLIRHLLAHDHDTTT